MTERDSPGGETNAGPDESRTRPPGDQATAHGSPVRASRRRPSAVTVVAVTYFIVSVAWAAAAIQSLIAAHILLPPGGGVLDTESLRRGFTLLGGIVAVRQTAVGVTAFVAAIALLRMHPRGWLLGVVAAVIVLAVQLVSWYDTTPNYILMALVVAVVLLMNQTEVRDAFAEETLA
jgi:hypothetical protein